MKHRSSLSIATWVIALTGSEHIFHFQSLIITLWIEALNSRESSVCRYPYTCEFNAKSSVKVKKRSLEALSRAWYD